MCLCVCVKIQVLFDLGDRSSLGCFSLRRELEEELGGKWRELFLTAGF